MLLCVFILHLKSADHNVWQIVTVFFCCVCLLFVFFMGNSCFYYLAKFIGEEIITFKIMEINVEVFIDTPLFPITQQ